MATSDMRDQLQTALGAQCMLEQERRRGGMATIDLATAARHRRSVALGVLHPELVATLVRDRTGTP